MKNIHILPTDKPTWLHKSLLTGILRKSSSCINDMRQAQGMDIYITSDEIVTEYSPGLYFIDVYTGKNYVFSPIKIDKESIHAAPFHSYMNNGNMCKRIIMTTDPILISNGVQAIDDEFLEWFVKNPSCDEVEIKRDLKEYIPRSCAYTLYYKIIIPKEEPKQILGVDFEMSIDDEGMSIEIPITKQETLEQIAEKIKGKELFKESNDRARQILSEIKSLPKQETLEETAKNYADKQSDSSMRENKLEFSKSGEELWEESKEDFIAGAKWQAERMHSDEEVLNIFDEWFCYQIDEDVETKLSFQQWFEQFKKK